VGDDLCIAHGVADAVSIAQVTVSSGAQAIAGGVGGRIVGAIGPGPAGKIDCWSGRSFAGVGDRWLERARGNSGARRFLCVAIKEWYFTSFNVWVG
jgi:hypothetical protein